MYDTTVTVVGRIASDVSSRRVGEDGQIVVSFRVVSTARRRDKVTGEWIDGDEFSARVKCWRAVGEGVATSLAKGDPVVVCGRLSVQNWETEEGRRYITEISADAVGPDLARSSAQVRRRRSSSPDELGGGAGSDGVGAGLSPTGGFSPAAALGVATDPSGRDGGAAAQLDDDAAELAAVV